MCFRKAHPLQTRNRPIGAARLGPAVVGTVVHALEALGAGLARNAASLLRPFGRHAHPVAGAGAARWGGNVAERIGLNVGREAYARSPIFAVWVTDNTVYNLKAERSLRRRPSCGRCNNGRSSSRTRLRKFCAQGRSQGSQGVGHDRGASSVGDRPSKDAGDAAAVPHPLRGAVGGIGMAVGAARAAIAAAGGRTGRRGGLVDWIRDIRGLDGD